jgi:Rod binding domain-containing protein
MAPTAAVSAPLPQELPPTLAHAGRRNADPKAIGKAFEGMFASMLLKQMRQSMDGGLFPGDSGDVLGGLFDHFIGEHIAKSGGFGIGDMIRSQLERRAERTPTT